MRIAMRDAHAQGATETTDTDDDYHRSAAGAGTGVPAQSTAKNGNWRQARGEREGQ